MKQGISHQLAFWFGVLGFACIGSGLIGFWMQMQAQHGVWPATKKEAIRATLEEKPNMDDADDLLVEVIKQACGTDRSGEVDSMAISAYADALRYLAKRGRFTIVTDVGGRVTGRWK